MHEQIEQNNADSEEGASVYVKNLEETFTEDELRENLVELLPHVSWKTPLANPWEWVRLFFNAAETISAVSKSNIVVVRGRHIFVSLALAQCLYEGVLTTKSQPPTYILHIQSPPYAYACRPLGWDGRPIYPMVMGPGCQGNMTTLSRTQYMNVGAQANIPVQTMAMCQPRGLVIHPTTIVPRYQGNMPVRPMMMNQSLLDIFWRQILLYDNATKQKQALVFFC